MIHYGDYPDHSIIKKILIIKLRHHGDVLLTSPVFSCLRKKFPKATIDALIYEETKPMLEGHPAISTIYSYNMAWKKLSLIGKIGRELKLIKRIRSVKYDVVINLTEGDRGAINAWITGAPVRIGWDPGQNGFLGKRKSYTHIIRRSQKPRHMVEQNLDACRRMGIFPGRDERHLYIHIPEEAHLAIRKHLKGLATNSYILLHLTSRWLFKCWPLQKNIDLVRALQDRGIPIVFSAAPDPMELRLIELIIKKCKPEGILNLSGKISLKELAALIQDSLGLITIDSVPMHLASVLQKPTIVLFGPSSEDAWGPWQNPNAAVLATKFSCRPCNLDGCGGGKVSDCLAAIKLSEVLNKMDELFVSDKAH